MPTRRGVDRGQRLEVVEGPGRAPGPRAQRTPLLGRAALPLVGEPDDARGEAGAVVGLDAGGGERHVAPAGGDELIGGRRGGGLREAREARQRVVGHVAPAEHHEDRDGSLCVDRHDHRHLDVDRDRGMEGVVDVPDHPPGDDRLAADGRLHGLGHRPRDLRHVLGHAAVDLALEVLDDLGTALLPPHFRGRDLPAVLQGQDVRPVRIGVGLGRVVVRGVRHAGGGPAVVAGPKLRDAQLSQHVGVVFARELVEPGPLLGAHQERVRRRRPGPRVPWAGAPEPRGRAQGDCPGRKEEGCVVGWPRSP